ncbi:MAG: hypothetical protein PHT38_08650, partial [Halothiobacillus sp.]|nr:hypothetical protein [Halothiobacillus sp.]
MAQSEKFESGRNISFPRNLVGPRLKTKDSKTIQGYKPIKISRKQEIRHEYRPPSLASRHCDVR